MPQFFRTNTPMGDFRSFKWVLDVSEEWDNGELYLVNDTVCLLFQGDIKYTAAGYPEEDQSLLFGEEGVFIYHIEKVIVNKENGSGLSSFDCGDHIYWSGVNGDPVESTWVSGYYWIGICVTPATDVDTTVEIDLKGDKATQGVMPT